MQTDASDYGFSAILLQKKNIIGIYSYKLKKSEKNYTSMQKKLYTIYKSLENFRQLIIGQQISIFSDNKNLSYE